MEKYGKYSQYKSAKQEKQIKRIIQDDVLANQCMLVIEMINNGFEGTTPRIDDEDIINFRVNTEEEAKEMGYDSLEDLQENGSDQKEVFEWWLVTKWLADKIEALGGVIIKSDYGTWWGREETGQSLTMDYHIKQVADVVIKEYKL